MKVYWDWSRLRRLCYLIVFTHRFITNFVIMNPYTIPACYYPPNAYYFTQFSHQQQGSPYAQDQDQKKVIQKLQLENADLKRKLAELQAYKQAMESKEKEASQMREYSELAEGQECRRRKKTIENSHTCPYEGCSKFYGTTLALNLHIKLKHNGGTKKQRQTYAKIIFAYEKNGEQPPMFDCNFPPGFLQEQRKLQESCISSKDQ